jgi:hypothetical protein
VQRYRGWFHLGGEEQLDAEVIIHHNEVEIVVEGESLTRPAKAVRADIFNGADFHFVIDEEQLFFHTEDPIGFVFDFLPALESGRRRRLPHFPRWRSRRAGPAVPAADTTETSDVVEPDSWTEIALGSTQREFLEVIQALANRQQRHTHAWSSEAPDCDVCRRTYIDLTQLEDDVIVEVGDC